MTKKIQTPLTREDVRTLKAGDSCLITGVIYTARDAAHKRLCELLEKINALGIGPQGFGGKTTALAVNIEYLPTHIAGLPVAVNLNCHVTRHKSEVL